MSKRMIIVIVAVLAIFGLIGYFAYTKNASKDSANQTGQAKLAEGTVIYDVRTKSEFDIGHVKGAKLLPDYEIANGKYPDVEKDSPIAVYCRSGNRSAGAKANLTKAGFKNVTDLGGLLNLSEYGLSADEKVVNP